MEPQARQLFVVQNNHFRGKALANALMLRHLLGEEEPPAPEGLLQAYPELEGLVYVYLYLCVLYVHFGTARARIFRACVLGFKALGVDRTYHDVSVADLGVRA